MHRGKKQKNIRFSIVMLLFVLIMAVGFGKLLGTEAKAEQIMEDVAVTPLPIPVESSVPTIEPGETPGPSITPKPQVSKLKKVTGVKLVRYSTKAVKVTWNKSKSKKVKYYHVYYSQKKTGKYKLAGVTKNQQLLVTKLKNKKKYYFYVQACERKKVSASDSAPSKTASMTMKTYQRKILFAGDSICEGVGYGQAFPAMYSSAKKGTVAYRGLNTITFHTKRIFDGMTGLQKVIAQKPYRLYMMLGMNEVHYRAASQMIADYKDMVKSIQQASPNTDIVLCAVSPVTRAERTRHPGMKQIPVFNRQLKVLAKKLGVRYWDYTDFLKDSGGYLKAEYASGDGYHWKPAAYTKFGEIVGKFDKSLDK